MCRSLDNIHHASHIRTANDDGKTGQERELFIHIILSDTLLDQLSDKVSLKYCWDDDSYHSYGCCMHRCSMVVRTEECEPFVVVVSARTNKQVHESEVPWKRSLAWSGFTGDIVQCLA